MAFRVGIVRRLGAPDDEPLLSEQYGFLAALKVEADDAPHRFRARLRSKRSRSRSVPSIVR